MALDVERIRRRYPALREGFLHFDGAAGTLVADRSAAAIATVTGGAVSNKSTAFAPGRRADEITTQARAAVADLVGGQPAGVVFGQSATALTYLVARTLAQGWGPGDDVVVSRLDHDANVRPWVQAAERVHATVRWAEVDLPTGELPLAQFADLIGPRTRLVAVTGASNAIGTMPDVPAIAAIARAAGALTYVDGVHRTPHEPIDVAELGADFYVTSAYKWSGPHIGACIAGPALWAGLHPDKLVPSPDTVPDRFEHGTASFELLAGVTGAVEHLATLVTDDLAAPGDGRRRQLVAAMAEARSHEHELFGALVGGLSGIAGVSLCPAPPSRCPTVAFRVADQHPTRTAEILGEQGICVFAGDYYAAEYFSAVGLRDSGGAVRASIYHYNTADEVARLVDAVAAIE